MSFETLLYATDGPVATITLNRPESLNTIVPPMPDEVEAAVGAAVRDAEVKVIVLRGAGRSFCAGYDFGEGFRHWGDAMLTDGRWDSGKDFAMATAPEVAPTQKLFSIWRSPKPVIAQVHGYCVGGGSDFALGADLVIASEDAVALVAAMAPRVAIPIHYEGWKHFRDHRADVERAIAAAPDDVAARFRWLPIGAPTMIPA